MILVILTETALFTIFVVAYLFYIGKSISGPYPHEVLELPILGTVLLLSSSVTIVVAERNLHKGVNSFVQPLVVDHGSSGRRFPDLYRVRVVQADLRRSSDDQHESFRVDVSIHWLVFTPATLSWA